MQSVCALTVEQSGGYEGAASSHAKAKVIDITLKQRPAKSQQKREVYENGLILQYRVKARKLGRSILRKWHARLELDEVDSVVDLSLCEAAKRFNSAKGASFMTFLYYHLRGNLIRAVSYAANANAVPGSEEGEEGVPTEDYGINAAEIAKALCGGEAELPDEALLKKELIGLSKEACNGLNALEREVIERIYLQGQQLMDIARELGYSRCHISRVKKKALETLYDEMTITYGIDNDSGLGPALDEESEGSNSRRQVSRSRVRTSRRSRSARGTKPRRTAAAG